MTSTAFFIIMYGALSLSLYYTLRTFSPLSLYTPRRRTHLQLSTAHGEGREEKREGGVGMEFKDKMERMRKEWKLGLTDPVARKSIHHGFRELREFRLLVARGKGRMLV